MEKDPNIKSKPSFFGSSIIEWNTVPITIKAIPIEIKTFAYEVVCKNIELDQEETFMFLSSTPLSEDEIQLFADEQLVGYQYLGFSRFFPDEKIYYVD